MNTSQPKFSSGDRVVIIAKDSPFFGKAGFIRKIETIEGRPVFYEIIINSKEEGKPFGVWYKPPGLIYEKDHYLNKFQDAICTQKG